MKLITTFLIYKIVVPTGSMSPTVEAGDQLIAVKVYNPSWIKRGDILVFKSDELNELLLKRVIGLPGEHVEIKSDGSVYVNEEKINEDYVRNPGGKNDMTFDVPDGKYLMLDDNRVNSFCKIIMISFFLITPKKSICAAGRCSFPFLKGILQKF